MKQFIFHKHESLHSCKYIILLIKKNNIFTIIQIWENEKLHVCENETLCSCKYNIINKKNNIIIQ